MWILNNGGQFIGPFKTSHEAEQFAERLYDHHKVPKNDPPVVINIYDPSVILEPEYAQ